MSKITVTMFPFMIAMTSSELKRGENCSMTLYVVSLDSENDITANRIDQLLCDF